MPSRTEATWVCLPSPELSSSPSHFVQASPGIQNEINASYQCFFPNGSDDKESVCSAGDLASIPGLGRFPGEGNGYPLQYSCLKISMDRGAWWAAVHGVTNTTPCYIHGWASNTDLGHVLCAKSLQSCWTLCDPRDHSLPGSSVHGSLQTRALEWIAIPFFRESSQPRNWTHITYVSLG